VTPDVRNRLRTRLEAALAALDAGDDAAVRGHLQAFADDGEAEVLADVSTIVGWMRAGVAALDLDDRLSRAAGTELPDLVGRLDAVIRTSEAAALQTLDLVETGQKEVERVVAALSTIPGEQRAVMAECAARLRANFAALAEAQAYQDLNGQTIGKVIRLLRGVEASLVALLEHAGLSAQVADGAGDDDGEGRRCNGTGPRIAGVDAPGVSQQEADDLLSDLGF